MIGFLLRLEDLIYESWTNTEPFELGRRVLMAALPLVRQVSLNQAPPHPHPPPCGASLSPASKGGASDVPSGRLVHDFQGSIECV